MPLQTQQKRGQQAKRLWSVCSSWKTEVVVNFLCSLRSLEFLWLLGVDLDSIGYDEFMMLFLLRKRSKGLPCGRNTWECCLQTMMGEVTALRRTKIPRGRNVAMAGSENVGDRSNIVFITCFSSGDDKSITVLQASGKPRKKWMKII